MERINLITDACFMSTLRHRDDSKAWTSPEPGHIPYHLIHISRGWSVSTNAWRITEHLLSRSGVTCGVIGQGLVDGDWRWQRR